MIQELSTESIVLGMLYRKPKLLEEYIELIDPEYDFSDESILFLYNILIDTFYSNNSITETSINITVSKYSQSEKNKFKKLGGNKCFERLASISEVSEDFKFYYDKLKSYNVLRYLENKGFPVQKDIDKLKDLNSDGIIKVYESQLLKVGSHIKQIHDSNILGKGILQVYKNLKVNPNIGIQLPYPLIDSICRGWGKSCLFASAMHSGFGKSRMIVEMLCHIGIINQIPILLLINEQEQSEIELMLLTCMANKLGAKYNIEINETEIALGQVDSIKEHVVFEASEYIENNTQIRIMELKDWSFENLKIILKKHKLRGIDYVVIDTFKPMRGLNNNNSPDWLNFAMSAEKLKELIGSEAKGGLNMGLWFTMQLTDESLITKTLGSSSIANAKQIKHYLDFLMMSRALDDLDTEKIRVKINNPRSDANGKIFKLNQDYKHYLTFIDKNRRGVDKQNIIFRVDKGRMIFTELGQAIF